MHVTVHISMVLPGQQRRFLAGLHVQVFALMVHEPIDHVLLAFRPSTTASSQCLTWWTVDGQREKVRGFGEVSDETPVEDEVDQNKNVHKKDQEKNNHPSFGRVIDSARGILLCHNSRVKILLLWLFQLWFRIVLHELAVARDRIRDSRILWTYPIMNEWRIDKALEQCAARQDRDGFGHTG